MSKKAVFGHKVSKKFTSVTSIFNVSGDSNAHLHPYVGFIGEEVNSSVGCSCESLAVLHEYM